MLYRFTRESSDNVYDTWLSNDVIDDDVTKRSVTQEPMGIYKSPLATNEQWSRFAQVNLTYYWNMNNVFKFFLVCIKLLLGPITIYTKIFYFFKRQWNSINQRMIFWDQRLFFFYLISIIIIIIIITYQDPLPECIIAIINYVWLDSSVSLYQWCGGILFTFWQCWIWSS